MRMANESLVPPPNNRNRASSTTLGSAFAVHTLGRRRSTSCLVVTDQPAAPHPVVPPQPSSMLDWLLSRFIYWLHVPQKHVSSWSTPSSPRSSTDDLILPLSTSTDTVTFSIHEPHTFSDQWQRFNFPPVSTWMLFVILLLPVSTAVVLWCLSTLPISVSWPHNIADLAQLGRELHGYSQSGRWPLAHVIGVMAVSAVWKHAWSIPGSVLWNMLAGALFSPMYATILLTALTTIGSACATLLSTPLGPFLEYLFPRALGMTRTALGAHSEPDHDESGHQNARTSAWVRLSVLRLIGVVPWSGINIACGVCGVSLVDCMLGTFIGCLPWTAVTCQIGDILQTVASTPTPTPQSVSSLLTTPEIILKLVFLSVLSLAPILGRARLHAMIAPSPFQRDRKVRWLWVQDWRTRISSSPRSRDQHDLSILVQEKRRLEDAS